MSYLLLSAILIIPTFYYRRKLKECETNRKKMIKDAWKWQWQDWGE